MATRTPISPLTAEDKEKFHSYVKKWQDKLGLNDWRILKKRKKTRNMAEVFERDVDARLATYNVGDDFGSDGVSDETLEATALHEVLHIFLIELMTVAIQDGIDQGQTLAAEHRVIHILEKLLLQKEKGQP